MRSFLLLCCGLLIVSAAAAAANKQEAPKAPQPAAPKAPQPAAPKAPQPATPKPATAQDKDIQALNNLSKQVEETKKMMDKDEVKKDAEMTEAQLKSQLKKYDSILLKMDRKAVKKINKHEMKKKLHHSDTLEEKNLRKRKMMIRKREKELLAELDKSEAQLRSIAPTFQGSMKESLRIIFKNQDKAAERAKRLAEGATAGTAIKAKPEIEDKKETKTEKK